MKAMCIRFRFLPPFLLGLTLWSVGAAEPDARNRILHLARTDDPQTLDPVMIQIQDDYLLQPLLYLPLLDNTNGVDLVGCGAKDWTVSPDARTFTFHLRPGLKFSNGREVVADDYAYFLERMSDPDNASPQFGYLAEFHIRGADDFAAHRTKHLAGVHTEGPETLVVELDQPDPTFLYVYITAQPREEVERPNGAYARRPTGDGPYMVDEWVRGARLVYKPNPYYGGPMPRCFDRIEMMIGGDSETHFMMFERGELDIASIEGADSVPEADQARIVHDPHWGPLVERTPVFGTYFVNLNTEMPPLTDRRVRQAINYAVDKTRRSGTGRFIPATGLIPPVMKAYNTNLVGYPYNPPKARQLLAETGIAMPIRLTLWFAAANQASLMLAEGIQADLHDVGIEIELKEATFSELNDAAEIRSNVEMSLSGWFTSMPDPKDILGSQFDGRTLTNSPTFNTSYYNNPEVNRLLDEASGTIDPVRRVALYRKTEAIIVDDAPCLFLQFPNIVELRQPWVKGALLEPLWPIRLDRVWIER
jgi:ABC-type transport system substrate-binding protein